MRNKSFTLIELLVVIVIIGILAGVIVISTSSAIDKANIAESKVFEESIQNNLAVNMVSRWKLDGDAKDAWGSNDGTIVGNLQTKGDNDCVSGKCMSFDGSSYISLGNPQDFQNIFPNNDWTISVWVKPDVRQTNENGGEIFRREGNHILLRVSGTTSPYFRLLLYDKNNVETSSSTTNIPLNQWTFIVTERRGRDFFVYVNGVVKISLTLSVNFDSFAVNANAFIGNACCSTYNYIGMLDDIRLYSSALPSSQIKQNYIAGLNSMLSNGNISKQEYNQRISNLSIK